MSYFWFNRQELLQKAKDKYHNCGGEEKAAEYYLQNKNVMNKTYLIRLTCKHKINESNTKVSIHY